MDDDVLKTALRLFSSNVEGLPPMLKQELNKRYVRGVENWCNARPPAGPMWFCSRAKGHDSFHAAHYGGDCVAFWD